MSRRSGSRWDYLHGDGDGNMTDCGCVCSCKRAGGGWALMQRVDGAMRDKALLDVEGTAHRRRGLGGW
jgi:hypothetical protein